MYRCEICGKECSDLKVLSFHVARMHKDYSKEEYYVKYFMKDPNEAICPTCGGKNKFGNLTGGYRGHCSQKCSANDPVTRQKSIDKNIEKFGVRCNLLLDSTKAQIKQTRLEKYGSKKLDREKVNKYKCELCGKSLATLGGVAAHIKLVHQDTDLEQYYIKYHILCNSESICPTCGGKNKFVGLSKGYRGHCSQKCSSNDPKTREKVEKTTLERFGVKHNMHAASCKEKIKQTNIKKYGVEYATQSTEIKNKTKQTILKKYGVEHHSQLEEVREKAKKTNLIKYGTENPTQNTEVKNKAARTNRERYGVDSYLASEEGKEKIKQTMLSRYGVENPNDIVGVREKIRQTNLKNNGVEYPMQSPEVLEKARLTLITKHGVDNYFKSDAFKKQSAEYYKQQMIDKIKTMKRLGGTVRPDFNLEEYTTTQEVYKWRCTKCSTHFEDTLADGRIPRCPTCRPYLTSTSAGEQEVAEFCKKHYKIIQNTRSILKNRELDIFIPSINLAIEYNGLHWHSELGGGKNRDYHYDKYLACKDKNIKLIQITEDEWHNKKEIIKSILSAKMNLIKTKIPARKCSIEIISNRDSDYFLENTHIQGAVRSSINIGLMYDNSLIALMTFGKDRFGINNYELLRYSTKLNAVVQGGFSKIFKYFVINYLEPGQTVVTYADLRYGDGEVYKYSGFNYMSRTRPGYRYLDSQHNLYPRQAFQKHLLENKLEIFDNTLTEWENMQLNNYDRIWDAGNNKYVFTLSN